MQWGDDLLYLLMEFFFFRHTVRILLLEFPVDVFSRTSKDGKINITKGKILFKKFLTVPVRTSIRASGNLRMFPCWGHILSY